MSKKLTLVLLTSVAILGACGSTGTNGEQTAPETTPQEEVTKAPEQDNRVEEKETVKQEEESSESTRLTSDEALDFALDYDGLTRDDIHDLEVDFDGYEDDYGVEIYEIEFDTETHEYEFDVDALSGELLDVEKDNR